MRRGRQLRPHLRPRHARAAARPAGARGNSTRRGRHQPPRARPLRTAGRLATASSASQSPMTPSSSTYTTIRGALRGAPTIRRASSWVSSCASILASRPRLRTRAPSTSSPGTRARAKGWRTSDFRASTCYGCGSTCSSTACPTAWCTADGPSARGTPQISLRARTALAASASTRAPQHLPRLAGRTTPRRRSRARSITSR
mmetsp:Transcript_45304/g.105981  ORF Transcript_45304/g.105981 Transcript_45304/m.105981 type:complete len:201 (-) Transcript_45304:405-1007(-)